MTTWTELSDQSTDFNGVADAENGYAVFGYVVNGYLLGSAVWSSVDDATTPWSEA